MHKPKTHVAARHCSTRIHDTMHAAMLSSKTTFATTTIATTKKSSTARRAIVTKVCLDRSRRDDGSSRHQSRANAFGRGSHERVRAWMDARLTRRATVDWRARAHGVMRRNMLRENGASAGVLDARAVRGGARYVGECALTVCCYPLARVFVSGCEWLIVFDDGVG